MSKIRPIKFRGYNKKRGIWLYGNYILNRGAHFIAPQEFADGKTWEDYEVEEESIGLYTGLVDRNGLEIYEGDFILHEDSTWGGVVQWHPNGYFFINDSYWKKYQRLDVYRSLGDMLDGRPFIVTGNIHDNPDNPDLIEKGGEQ